MAATANTLTVAPGAWRAEGAVLTIAAKQSRIELGSGAVVTDGPLKMDAKGNFKTTGLYEAYTPGPQQADRSPPMRKTHIEGRITGSSVVMNLHVDGERTMRHFVFTQQGRAAKLVRPL